MLCFAVFPVPGWLAAMLANRPLAKKWLIECLNAKEFGYDFPGFTEFPHPLAEAAEDFFTKRFDMEGCDFNFKVQISGGIIQLMTCTMLPTSGLDLAFGNLHYKWLPVWQQYWDDHKQPARLDVQCQVTGRSVSYESAREFFKYFCTGSVEWLVCTAELNVAEDILVLASFFQTLHLKAAAEVALQRFIDNKICCLSLSMADKYNAAQLKSYCLWYAGRTYHTLDKSDVRKMSAKLQAQVRQASL